MKKFLIPILLIVGIIGAYWVAYGNPIDKIFKRSNPDQPDDTSTGSVPADSASVSPNSTAAQSSFMKQPVPGKDAKGFPLSVGSRGQYVEIIQKALNERFGSNLVVDGVFGTKTAKALSTHGYNPDAIYYKHFNEIVGFQYWK
jgi:peptidoglycan hydrolase-like protein with peptidoglycan-binding domain